MPAIDHEAFRKAMDMAGETPATLARKLGSSTSYVARIAVGSRKLKRNPVLRKRIAEELNVPVRWIETQDGAA